MQCLGINTFYKIINYRITLAMIKMYSHNLLIETISSWFDIKPKKVFGSYYVLKKYR